MMRDDDVERAQAARSGNPYLTTRQAAHYLSMSPRTLQRLRVAGKGPRTRRHTRTVLYHIDDLDSWSRDQVEPVVREPKGSRS
jgi:hypothetical protein